MTKLSQKVAAAMTAGVMFLSMASSVAASTTLEITGNGSDSTNGVAVTQTSTTTVQQSNSANVTNDVKANADTGSNDASRNTGGSTTVDTGNANTNVAVSNTLNSNAANVACCSANSDTSVLISGNGDKSTNGVDLTQGSTSDISVDQTNTADVKNNVDANANSGKNDAKSNTGGDVTVNTGDATTNVAVNTTANANVAQVGGNSQDGTGSVDLSIVGNGSDTQNAIALDLEHSIVLEQSNSASVSNDVNAGSTTGKNDAGRNTGGDVMIDTGNANTTVGVDNAVNFNFANVDCGCLLDVAGKVAGNGTDSTNNLLAALGSDQIIAQGNCGNIDNNDSNCKLNNDVNANAGSGANDNKSNTGTPLGGDPTVWTGNAASDTEVSNSGNANVYGAALSTDLPSFDFGFNLNQLSLNQLWLLLGIGH